MKKFLFLFSFIGFFIFNSCGGGGSSKAKEILKVILQVIGIPQESIINICQTTNSSDICKGVGLKLNEKPNFTSFQKIEEISEGRFLLETKKPCEPILLELQDSDIAYDNEEFFLKFSGVQKGVKEKELSVLQAMVDTLYLQDNLYEIKNLNSDYAQNEFYKILYQDLKIDINTLRDKGLTKTQSIRGTLQEMASELTEFGVYNTLPQSLNNCNNNTNCIDSILQSLSDNLLINNIEAEAIFISQKDNNSPLIVKEVVCEEEQEQEEEERENNINTQEHAYWIIPNGIMKDTIHEKDNGRTIPEFIDLSQMEVKVTDTNILVKMTMVNLPSQLTYNRDTRDDINGGDSWTEYVWQCKFLIGKNDIYTLSLSISINGGNPNEGEKIGYIKDIAGINLWEKGIGNAISSNSNKYLSVLDNTLIMNIPKSLNNKLNLIDSKTKVHFSTQHAYNGNEEDMYHDNYLNSVVPFPINKKK
jgi:hypothetical protein